MKIVSLVIADLLSCSPADGTCGLLVKETWPTWVNLREDLRLLKDGRFLWTSEKSGWRRLYLHDELGRELKALTPEGWALTTLNAVDEKAGTFVFTAYEGKGLGAKDRLVFGGNFAGDELLNFLQMLGLNGRTGSLSVRTSSTEGMIYLEDGRVVGGEFLGLKGAAGARAVAALESGHFEFIAELPIGGRQTEAVAMSTFLLDLSRESDEQRG